MVPLARVERALLAELDFESSASTNSATGARVGRRCLAQPVPPPQHSWREQPRTAPAGNKLRLHS